MLHYFAVITFANLVLSQSQDFYDGQDYPLFSDYSKPPCKTVFGKECAFPFQYKNKTYEGCTNQYAYNGNFWCPTSVTEDGLAVISSIAPCDPKECVISNKPCLSESGRSKGKPCQFPFIYGGKTYTGCAKWTWPGKNFGKYWCSTKVDKNRKHVKGNVGFCGFCENPSCGCGECRPPLPLFGAAAPADDGFASPVASDPQPPFCEILGNCGEEEDPRDNCVTKTGQKCVFPFNYKGKRYSKCTHDDSEDGNAWCPTRVNDDRTPVQGSIQPCDSSVCNYPEPCITVSGPDKGNNCKFPFRHNGETHYQCAQYKWENQNHGKYWCSTKVDENDNHINNQGNIGFCGFCDNIQCACGGCIYDNYRQYYTNYTYPYLLLF